MTQKQFCNSYNNCKGVAQNIWCLYHEIFGPISRKFCDDAVGIIETIEERKILSLIY